MLLLEEPYLSEKEAEEIIYKNIKKIKGLACGSAAAESCADAPDRTQAFCQCCLDCGGGGDPDPGTFQEPCEVSIVVGGDALDCAIGE